MHCPQWQLSRLADRFVVYSIPLFFLLLNHITFSQQWECLLICQRLSGRLIPAVNLQPLRTKNVVDSSKCFVNRTREKRTSDESFSDSRTKKETQIFSFLLFSFRSSVCHHYTHENYSIVAHDLIIFSSAMREVGCEIVRFSFYVLLSPFSLHIRIKA